MTKLGCEWLGIVMVGVQWILGTFLLMVVLRTASAQHQYNNVSGYACTRNVSFCESYAFYRPPGSESNLTSIASVFNTSVAGIANASGIDSGAATTLQTSLYVPLACSCTNGFYQAPTSHVVVKDETMYTIANSTYQGLTTYQAIQAANPAVNASTMQIGQLLRIPLRCACPPILLSYPIFPEETLTIIGERFNVSVAELQATNNVTDPATMLAFTTILIPLPALVPLNSSAFAPPAPAPPVSAPPPVVGVGESEPSKAALYIGVGVGAAGVALAMVLACVLCATIAHYRKIIRDKGDGSEKRSLMIKSENSAGSYGGNAGSHGLVGMTAIVGSDKPLQFSYQQLLTATNNFSSENRIQGSVFLGKLKDSLVAIKQMKGNNMTDEFKILSQVHHGNVVRLVGMCASPNENLYLVYEYAENGSLSDCLHHQTAYPDSSVSRSVGLLSWRRRVQIALDVACGLEYLHNYTKPSLVHKDVKSSNILLDQQFRAKVTNFGMAKSSHGGAMMTSNIVGTQGYMAPEYLEHGMVTTRADVFSFGVVLLELLSGREAIAGLNTPLHTTVPKTENELGAWIDPRLQNAYPRDIAWSVASLAKTCVATDPAQRPDMKEISFRLSKLCQASQEWESSTRYNSAAIEAR